MCTQTKVAFPQFKQWRYIQFKVFVHLLMLNTTFQKCMHGSPKGEKFKQLAYHLSSPEDELNWAHLAWKLKTIFSAIMVIIIFGCKYLTKPIFQDLSSYSAKDWSLFLLICLHKSVRFFTFHLTILKMHEEILICNLQQN